MQKISTVLKDLYGFKHYKGHIEVGREYWWCWPPNTDIYQLTNQSWNKIKVTYIRSGCMFYVLPEFPDISEHFCALDSYLAASLQFVEFDPTKDIDPEVLNKSFIFDDSRTIIKNWDNDPPIDDRYEVYSMIF